MRVSMLVHVGNEFGLLGKSIVGLHMSGDRLCGYVVDLGGGMGTGQALNLVCIGQGFVVGHVIGLPGGFAVHVVGQDICTCIEQVVPAW